MGIRIANKFKAVNDSEMYAKSEIFENRRVKRVTQYLTPSIKHPTQDEMSRFLVIRHIWSLGDRFFKLSHEHYGDSKYWWIMPWFNQKPLESDFTIGDIIFIPKPLEEALTYFE
jgi:hypothetical protein